MTAVPVFSLRPQERREPANLLDGAFRVHIPVREIKSLGLEVYGLCGISNANGTTGVGIAYPAQDSGGGGAKRIAKVTDLFRDFYGFNLQDRVTLSESTVEDTTIESIVVSPVDGVQTLGEFTTKEELKTRIRTALELVENVIVGGAIEISKQSGRKKGSKRRFVIKRVEPEFEAGGSIGLRYVNFDTKIEIEENPSDQPSSPQDESILRISGDGVGGLDDQIEKINKRLESIIRPSVIVNGFRRPLNTLNRGGILLHGPHGVGKSLLLDKLSKAPWRKTYVLTREFLGSLQKDGGKGLLSTVNEAKALQPSLMIIDRLDAVLASADEGLNHTPLTESLLLLFDHIRGARVLIAGATSNLQGIDKRLRSSRAFGTSIELPIPDANARADIFKTLLESDLPMKDELATRVGNRTHGYVGEDLADLYICAIDKVEERLASSRDIDACHVTNSSGEASSKDDATTETSPKRDPSMAELLTDTDIAEAMSEIRPSAMKEVFLETPKVFWVDIGGSETVQKALYGVTVRPFKHPNLMRDLDITPPKGILLYGPPGCSKTLTAKAVATEGGLNFIAVKGAELLNMYVGESERAVREVFRKARAASPSIIFFDEIDAIGASTRGRGLSGLNVVTTLLNEMDGIESLQNVLVLAATNAPEVLDPALTRPGRIDTMIYIGPPNAAARLEIFKIQTRKRRVSSNVNLGDLASRTEGYSGAEVVSICNLAANAAAEDCEREGGDDLKTSITTKHFETALNQVVRQITPDMLSRYQAWLPGGTTKLL